MKQISGDDDRSVCIDYIMMWQRRMRGEAHGEQAVMPRDWPADRWERREYEQGHKTGAAASADSAYFKTSWNDTEQQDDTAEIMSGFGKGLYAVSRG